jgi:hypothetical protein
MSARVLQGMPLLVAPVSLAVQVAASAALVAVVAVLVFVAHPRTWWMNRAFDVEGYVADELLPRVNAALRKIAAAARQPGVPRAAGRATVTRDFVVKVERVEASKAGTVSIKDFVLKHLPTAASLPPDAELLTADDLGKRLIDMLDVSSARLANKGRPPELLMADCWAMHGTPLADYLRDSMGGFRVVASVDRESLSGIRAGLSNPDLAAVFAGARLAADDDAIALLAECVAADSDDAAWRLLRRELDAVLDVVSAVADLRSVCTFVFPQLKRMRLDRRPDLSLMDVFVMFNMPYLHQFMRNYHRAVKEYESTTDAIWLRAERMVEALKKRVKNRIKGKEGFAQSEPPAQRLRPAATAPYVRRTAFGVRVDEGGGEAVVEEFNPMKILKPIGQVFKLLPKLIKLVFALFEALFIIVKALVKLIDVLAKSPADFLVKLILLLIDAWLLVALIVAGPVFTALAWAAMALLPLAVQLCFFCAILLWAAVMNAVLALLDAATGGALRHLALSEEHPESWFLVQGAHSGNGTSRVFGTFYPCASGYSCGFVPLYCQRVSRCQPLASPQAMLAHNLRFNKLRPTMAVGRLFAHPVFPSDSVACSAAAKRYRAQSAELPTCNNFTIDKDVLQELLVASCAARMRSADAAAAVCELCRDAVGPPHREWASQSGVPADASLRERPSVDLSGAGKAAVSVVAAALLAAVAYRAAGLQAIAAG